MFAMDVNDNVGSLTPRGVLGYIASMLAPTRPSAMLLIVEIPLMPVHQRLRRIELLAVDH